MDLHLLGSDYFSVLAALLLQKLVRACTKITMEGTSYLRSFLDGLCKHSDLTGTGEDHEASLKACAAPPGFNLFGLYKHHHFHPIDLSGKGHGPHHQQSFSARKSYHKGNPCGLRSVLQLGDMMVCSK